jgi:hypothetical protein
MRTALRELIDDLNKEIANCESNGLQYRGIYLDARWKAENLLEKEKQQIVDAVNSQRQIGWDEKGEDYYRSVFCDPK